MNAHDPNPIEPILHTAKGEPPRSESGRGFLDSQAEMFQPDIAAHRCAHTWIGVLELDNGKWLAYRTGFAINDPQYDGRAVALRVSIAAAIRKFRRFGRNQYGERWEWGLVGRICDWALSLKPQVPDPSDVLDNIDSKIIENASDREAKPAAAAAHEADLQITDPIVAELVAQNKARELYPPGHVVRRTIDYSDPDKPMSIGACDCGASFAYRPSQHHQMDAAIEAHWQKFDALPDKVDGRGQPIKSENAAVANPAAPDPASPDSKAHRPASGAGSSYSDDDDLTIDWPSYDGFLESKIVSAPLRGIAILKGRRGAATELAAPYFLDGVKYLQMAEERMTTPQLFDLAKFDEANAPPPPRIRGS